MSACGPSCGLGPLALLVCCAALLLPAPAAAVDGDWVDGRATFYDDNQQGSCKYYGNVPHFYGAWPDTLEGFAGSCGKCVEVACVNKDFGDNYGGWLERSSACYDQSRTVVLQIVDSCPCVHANAYSNRRWCCGDMKHLDLGRPVFRQLAQERWGVIGARWRVVDCSRLGSVNTLPGGAPAAAGAQPAPGAAPQPLTSLPVPDLSSDFTAPAWGHFSATPTTQLTAVQQPSALPKIEPLKAPSWSNLFPAPQH